MFCLAKKAKLLQIMLTFTRSAIKNREQRIKNKEKRKGKKKEKDDFFIVKLVTPQKVGTGKHVSYSLLY